MKHLKMVQGCVRVLAICTLLISCQVPDGRSAGQTSQSDASNGSVDQSPSTERSASPTPGCIGWSCEIDGIVYLDAAEPGNELEGIRVNFSQISWCSPTAGKQETLTDANGSFSFEVFIHDTDSYKISVDVEGYQTAEHKMGGFDCLFCYCPLVEIVLKAE
ncbi:MAG: hypothetical protein Q7J07_06075 [Pelolinea sp.]|nr:hypothetical protein [Pelolinea sp.]